MRRDSTPTAVHTTACTLRLVSTDTQVSLDYGQRLAALQPLTMPDLGHGAENQCGRSPDC